MCVNAAMAIVAILAATLLRIMLQRLNRRLDAAEAGETDGTLEHAVTRNEEQGLPGLAVEKGFRFLV